MLPRSRQLDRDHPQGRQRREKYLMMTSLYNSIVCWRLILPAFVNHSSKNMVKMKKKSSLPSVRRLSTRRQVENAASLTFAAVTSRIKV
jgi:delta-aminolevulinic acid dehydratase/porphobilinogen synthase